MPQVHLLSDDLANRIAAGEVVERPASVVKELVENAIDAKASRIEIVLVDGGKKLIRVTDDGHGMPAEDARLAVQRFATSKVAQAEDLDAIDTMGFRGEALPSIAAVSHFRLATREHDAEEAFEVRIHGGGSAEFATVGAPAGTTVEVTDLFFNTPARAKFQSSSGRERGHCVDWVSRLALSRPDIAFKLTHGGEVVFSTSGAGDIRSVIAAIYGSTSARDFLPVDFEQDGLHVTGLVSKPILLRSTRAHQMFFVNRRFVRSRQMSHALEEAYGLLVPSGRHPLCALHVAVDPLRVDPNVHPTKIEVRFRQRAQVHQLVQRAVEASLAEAGLRSLSQAQRHGGGAQDAGGIGGMDDDPFRRSRGPALRAGAGTQQPFDMRDRAQRLRVNPFEDQVDDRDDGLEVHDRPAVELPRRTTAEEPAEEPFSQPGEFRVLGQLALRYIVVETSTDLLLVDQHRAAEKAVLARLQPGGIAKQMLIAPETLSLSASEAEAARESMELLGELGYELEPFGAGALLLRSVPAGTAYSSPVEALRAVIADLAEWEAISSADRRREKLMATIACHAAIKAGERLSMREMETLIEATMESETPAMCPHGDPVIVAMPMDRLDRQFKRHPSEDRHGPR